jgi:hypothetical protein
MLCHGSLRHEFRAELLLYLRRVGLAKDRKAHSVADRGGRKHCNESHAHDPVPQCNGHWYADRLGKP